MKRRRRIHSAWNWANNGELVLQDSGISGAALSVSVPILPAPRVDWLLEQGRGRDHLVVTGILLWLDFFWTNGALLGSGLNMEMQPVDFWVRKWTEDNGALLQIVQQPFLAPAVPSSVTSWNTAGDDEADGLDPFLWTHHLSEAVPGTVLGPESGLTGITLATNAGFYIPPAGTVQPNMNVRAAWQPDVHIKSKRRLTKSDSIRLGFTIPTQIGNNLIYSLAYHVRILTT